MLHFVEADTLRACAKASFSHKPRGRDTPGGSGHIQCSIDNPRGDPGMVVGYLRHVACAQRHLGKGYNTTVTVWGLWKGSAPGHTSRTTRHDTTIPCTLRRGPVPAWLLHALDGEGRGPIRLEQDHAPAETGAQTPRRTESELRQSRRPSNTKQHPQGLACTVLLACTRP